MIYIVKHKRKKKNTSEEKNFERVGMVTSTDDNTSSQWSLNIPRNEIIPLGQCP